MFGAFSCLVLDKALGKVPHSILMHNNPLITLVSAKDLSQLRTCTCLQRCKSLLKNGLATFGVLGFSERATRN